MLLSSYMKPCGLPEEEITTNKHKLITKNLFKLIAMKKNYQSPAIEETLVAVESGIAASSTLWYEQGGQGDFNYVVSEDETWG